MNRLLVRLRNIIYYYNIDDRPRKQYIHVLRELRNDIISSDDFKYKDRILEIIPKNIISKEIELTMEILTSEIYVNLN